MAGTAGLGRPKGVPNIGSGEIRTMCRRYGPRAVSLLAQLAGLEPPEDVEPPSEWARMTAIKELLDRAYGKSSQPLSNDPHNPLALQFVIRAPAAVESTQEWLQRYAPRQIEGAAVDTGKLQTQPSDETPPPEE
jgi:hypothetical protein